LISSTNAKATSNDGSSPTTLYAGMAPSEKKNRKKEKAHVDTMMMFDDGLQESSMCSFPPQPHANRIKEDYKLFSPFSI
jgi:hypothetical protein